MHVMCQIMLRARSCYVPDHVKVTIFVNNSVGFTKVYSFRLTIEAHVKVTSENGKKIYFLRWKRQAVSPITKVTHFDEQCFVSFIVGTN